MPVKNEAGNKYGRLTVLERVENNYRGDAQWLCVCDCGNEIITRGIDLRSGHTKSCGCLQKEHASALGISNTADLIGKRFGRLVVTERVGSKWRCNCDCGGYTITKTDSLKSGKTMSCGCISSQSECIIASTLSERGVHFVKEFTFPDLKSDKNYLLRFDFAIFKNNSLAYLIEYDGAQHFDTTSPFYHERIPINDARKDQYCLDNHIRLYRINYKQDLEKELENILKKEGIK